MCHGAPSKLKCQLIVYFSEREFVIKFQSNISDCTKNKIRKTVWPTFAPKVGQNAPTSWNATCTCISVRGRLWINFMAICVSVAKKVRKIVWPICTYSPKVDQGRTNSAEMKTHSYIFWGKIVNKFQCRTCVCYWKKLKHFTSNGRTANQTHGERRNIIRPKWRAYKKNQLTKDGISNRRLIDLITKVYVEMVNVDTQYLLISLQGTSHIKSALGNIVWGLLHLKCHVNLSCLRIFLYLVLRSKNWK